MAKAKGFMARTIARVETRGNLFSDKDPSISALLLANARIERWCAAQANPESAGYQ